MVSVVIREVVAEDAASVARLSGELGYPAAPEAMRQRMEWLRASPDHAIYVACVAGEVVGWIEVAHVRHLAADPRAEIHGLVVSGELRSSGIGRRLVARGEQWARERGLSTMSVRSNVAREAAHRFYICEGYVRTKTAAVFVKGLD